MLRLSIPGVRMFTKKVFCRGRHGQESEAGKEDREGSHQEGGKEDLKEKEVIVSATEKWPPPGRSPDAKRNLSKGSQMSFAAVRYREGIIRPDLCAAGYCIKVRFFVSAPASGMICSCAKDRCRMAATFLRRGSREPGPRTCGRAPSPGLFEATGCASPHLSRDCLTRSHGLLWRRHACTRFWCSHDAAAGLAVLAALKCEFRSTRSTDIVRPARLVWFVPRTEIHVINIGVRSRLEN
jgi:hypothetical protein